MQHVKSRLNFEHFMMKATVEIMTAKKHSFVRFDVKTLIYPS